MERDTIGEKNILIIDVYSEPVLQISEMDNLCVFSSFFHYFNS